MCEQTLESCGVLRQLRGPAIGSLHVSQMSRWSPYSLIHSFLSAAEPGALLSSHRNGINEHSLPNWEYKMWPHFLCYPNDHLALTSSHIPTWAPQWVPQFCRQFPKMQPKVVLKEVSLILLPNPPACLPSALCSSKSMENTFPHNPAEAMVR